MAEPAIRSTSPGPMMAPGGEQSDEALALAAREGDARAFGEIVERYQARLTAFLRRRTLASEDAVDLAQESFARAWSNLGRFDAERSFRVWLFTIAARLSADLARRESRRAQRERAAQALRRANPADAAERAEQAEAASRIWRLADEALTEQQRSILWLRYAEDLSIDQIARALGKTGVTVRVNLHRARAVLRERIERQRRRQDHPRPRTSAQGGGAPEQTQAHRLRATCSAAFGEV